MTGVQTCALPISFEKGFKLAVGSWGKELPDICQDTYDAVSKRFDEYYLSKQ